MIIDAKKLFLTLRVHHGFAPADRPLDLKHRVATLVANVEDPSMTEFTRYHLQRIIDKRTEPPKPMNVFEISP